MAAAKSSGQKGFAAHWESNPLLSSVFALWRSLAAGGKMVRPGKSVVARSGKSSGKKKKEP
ncbi:MAG: hypothetical protein A3I10_06445 [Deltaproteobacteria bacterium RIFCSPLOWO2_02_FULL_57_26]|nr:MAG: hypothetical protein A3I10_06445 [Deltaproteobacteria bacterium RIFCSPLOWO2_02_FULL_57_26]OGQ83144.1 MAG: hypothetical protein A3G40_01480 [Deltaproteobacteria bacterium RIFCSPLOWO2_12_FULL_57_22]